MIIQILLLIFVVFAFSRVVLRFRAHEITTREFFLWFLFWILAGVTIAWPDIASRIAFAVGVGRGVDVVIYSALLLVFYVLFRLVARIERMERDITLLVRRKALEEHDHEPR